jgi:hypothetical protein
MKTQIIGLFIFLFTINSQAQNTNVKDETKTTTTTITNSDGDKTYVKKENTREVQNIELKEEKANTLNIETKDSPVQVTTTTKITNPDGTTRTVDIDRSSYYILHGKKFNVTSYKNGYRLLSEDKKTTGLLRKTSTNTFIYKNGTKTAIGYFDANGDLVLENYNPKTDEITYETYKIVKQ